MSDTTKRASLWSVTINNPTEQDLEGIALARQKGWDILGQAERGENGTRHYQLAVKTPQVRFSAVKKQFPRGHIEVARSVPALLRYVTKEATREGDLPETQDKYPSLSKYWDLVFDYLNGLGKDGLDYMALEENVVCMYREEIDKAFKKNPLHLLDEATGSLISSGYHVESIAANPSTRSMWKLYHKNIILRSYSKMRNVEITTQQDADDYTQQDGCRTPSELQSIGRDEAYPEACSTTTDETGSEISS